MGKLKQVMVRETVKRIVSYLMENFYFNPFMKFNVFALSRTKQIEEIIFPVDTSTRQRRY